MRPVFPIALALLAVLPLQPAGPIDLEACLKQDDDRPRCFEQRLPETPDELPDAVAALKSLGDPTATLEALDLIEARFEEAPDLDPGLRADLLDLRGQALHEIGRFEDAARAYRDALSLDDGCNRLTWLGPDDGGWSVLLDVGNRRLERAARSFSAAGRHQDAEVLGARIHAVDGALSDGVPLAGRRWHPTLLDIEIPLLEGGSFSMAGARGQVLVLEFWATWCAPCWDTLPALQRLYESEHERGLAVVAVNAKESRHIALPAVREIGLTMPIGEYTDEIDELFQVNTLPTVIVADRKGRVRGRWNRLEIGVVDDVASLVRQLIGETDDGDPDPPVARVVTGGELFRVEWMRGTPARPQGLVIAPGADAEEGVLTAQGGSLVLYGRDGRIVRDWSVPAATGLLRRGDSSMGGGFPVVGFRPGGRTLILLDMPEGRLETWEAPAPVFDAIPAHGHGSSWEIVVGTSDSLIHVAGERLRRPLADSRVVSSLARFGPKADAWLVSLSAGMPGPSHLIWLDRSLNEIGRLEGPGNAWRLIVDPDRPDRVGVAPAEVTAAAVGRFVDGGSTQAAVATRSGQLVVVDLDTGKELFRAHWNGAFISHLASGDLDGDGLDELAVASGRDLVLLSRGDR